MKFVRYALVLTTFASLQAAPDPRLLGLMMPDANMVAGVQIEQSRNSPLGQFILRNASGLPFDALQQAGFDPRTQLTEIVAAAVPGQSLLAGRGAFQSAKILSLAQEAGVPFITYRGATLLSANNQTESLVFLDSSTVVVGTTAAVQGAVDRWLVGTAYAGPLASKIGEVSTSSHAWAVATGLDQILPAEIQNDAMRNILATITRFSGGLLFGATDVQATSRIETRSAQDAQSMADVLRLLATMAPNPQLASAATFSNNGSFVDVKVSLTEQQVEDLLKPVLAPRVLALR